MFLFTNNLAGLSKVELLLITTFGRESSVEGFELIKFIVLFGVECFFSKVLVLDSPCLNFLISLETKFFPPSLHGDTTEPCKTRRDSGCLDLKIQRFDISW